MYVRPTAPLSIGGVIDDAIRVYSASFSRCWIPALLVAVLAGILAIYFSINIFSGISRTDPRAMLHAYSRPGVYGLYLVQWVVSAGLYGAIFLAQDSATGGSERSLGDAFGTGFARLGWALIAGICFGVAIMLGFVLLIVPGIWVMGALCLWPVALYIDGAGPLESLGVSHTLTRGNWWRTSVILTVAFVIIVVLMTVIGIVAGMLTAFLRRDFALAIMGVQSVTMVANVFVLPMYTAILLSIYRDLKLRREGGDLAARLEAVPAG
ncbi:MAG TPA: hypothetical protein VGL50_05630 [Steroidobacteraceae bacterium]|jgi:hypothetical protein